MKRLPVAEILNYYKFRGIVEFNWKHHEQLKLRDEASAMEQAKR